MMESKTTELNEVVAIAKTIRLFVILTWILCVASSFHQHKQPTTVWMEGSHDNGMNYRPSGADC